MPSDSSRLLIDLGKKNTDTATNTAFKWAINSGRIIIVMVELLTLGALGFRFFIDRQIVDFHEKIEQQQNFVNAQETKEKGYRNLQQRLTDINSLTIASEKQIEFINSLTKILSSNSFIKSDINATDDGINVDGQVYNIFTLNDLVDTLKDNPNIVGISVDDVTSTDQGVHFKLVAQYK